MIEWKVIRIEYLQIEGMTPHSKASTLRKLTGVNGLLKVKFGANDIWTKKKPLDKTPIRII